MRTMRTNPSLKLGMAAKSLQKLNEANGELINDESNLEDQVVIKISTFKQLSFYK